MSNTNEGGIAAMDGTAGFSDERIDEIIAALTSAGEEVLVKSRRPLVLFHCSSIESPVNCLFEKPWSTETMYCGFVCDDGVGNNPAVRFASENVRVEWLLENAGDYADEANREHDGLGSVGRLFPNRFLAGGLNGVPAQAIASFDADGYAEWFELCLNDPAIRPKYAHCDDLRPDGSFPPIDVLSGQEESALDAFAGDDDWLRDYTVSREIADRYRESPYE